MASTTTTRRARPEQVRLVRLAHAAGRCAVCGSAMFAAGRFAVDVDGAQPCDACLRGRLGEHAARFVDVDLEHLASRLAALPRAQRAVAVRLLLDAAELLAGEHAPTTRRLAAA